MISPSRGHLGVPGDISGYHPWKQLRDVGGMLLAWVRILLNFLQCTGQAPTRKSDLSSNVNSAKSEKPRVGILSSESGHSFSAFEAGLSSSDSNCSIVYL